MKKASLHLLAPLAALALLLMGHLSCGGGVPFISSDEAPQTPVAVAGLTLSRNSMTLAAGKETGTLVPAISPHNAANKNITWSSNNPAIASVSQNGVVTPLYVGKATVTAITQDGAKAATCSIDVVSNPIAATGAYLNKNELSIAEGGGSSLALNFIPAQATNQNVTWQSSNTSVATVDQNGAVTAKKAGAATITAVYQQEPSTSPASIYDEGKVGASAATTLSASLTVASKSVPATGVEMDPKTLELSEGGSGLLFPTVLPHNATNVNVSFSSSSPAVASVSSLGLVTGRAAGVTLITVTTQDGGHKDTCYVIVTSSTVRPTGVSLNKTALELGGAGETERLSATVSPSNATDKSLYWRSSNESVAAVNMNGTVQARAAGTATVTVETQVGGYRATCTVTVKGSGGNVPVSGVSLNKTSTTISVGGIETLTATVLPANATNRNVTWASSNTSVALVSSGIVTGVAAGTANITVTTQEGGKTATCVVTVGNVPVTGVSLNKATTSINVGASETLIPTILPSNATNKNVSWYSSSPSIATVSNNGTVTGVAAGMSTIFVLTQDGSKVAQCAVTVTSVSVPVTGVTLNKSATSINVGVTETLIHTVLPSNATNKIVAWTSSSNAIATVNSNGTVTGVSAGTATITVTTQDGNKTATCSVTVGNIPVSGVSLNKTSTTIGVGSSDTLTATIAPSNATNKNVTWSSNNTGIATVNGGIVTGVSAGSATITVTTQDGGKTANCLVTVNAQPVAVTGVTLNKTSTAIGVGSSETLTATVAPSNATNKAVTWSSSSTTVATVNANGLVTAVAVGTVTITVTTQDGNKTATCNVTVTDNPDPIEPSVYVAGSSYSYGLHATLWKNGVPQQLSSDDSYASSVFVSGSDVYVAGDENQNRAVLWKNGTRQQLSNDESEANSVFVSGGDVYVAGWDHDVNSDARAVLWKNGTRQQLSNNYSRAYSVYVSGNDVYVAGKDNGCAVLWKNGNRQQLSTNYLSFANSVFVSGGDVYVAGHDNECAVLWKNGTRQQLSSNLSVAKSVYVSGNDVYVAVYDEENGRSELWKNGTRQQLGNGSYATSVFVSGNDVYVAGKDNDCAVLWKNGTRQQLSNNYYSVAYSVFVK